MKKYTVTLRARGPELSARAVLEAVATHMGLNLEPRSRCRDFKHGLTAYATVAGSEGRAHLSLVRSIPGGAS